jgi:hypothetical protein
MGLPEFLDSVIEGRIAALGARAPGMEMTGSSMGVPYMTRF